MPTACAVLLAACATLPPPQACPPAAAPVAWVVDHGWHTEIGLPVSEIAGPLGIFRGIFPGAQVLMFGFGKRTFFTAKTESPSEWLLGPVPGPAAIQVVALPASPEADYDLPVVRLALPPGGAAGLSAFLWAAIARTKQGAPRLIAPGLFPGSLFFAAIDRYALDNDCNGWVARAMRAAGLPVRTGAIFAAGVMRQAVRLGLVCRIG
jgi:hypothetical protein